MTVRTTALGRGLVVARVGGTEVVAHWSLPVLWLVVAAALAPALPGTGPGAARAVGLAAGVLLSASVLAHELAHTVVARAGGVPVPIVTLWALGGLSELGARPRTPARTVAVAVAGPATSAAVGAVCLAAAAAAGSGPVAAALGWLGVVNVVLAVFNLVPGAPLDGGRVLAGAVWWRTGSRGRGDLWAARAGVLAAAVLAVLGVAGLAAGGGLWLLAVAWFLAGSAWREHLVARVELAAVGRTAGDVCVPLAAPVAAAVTAHGVRAMGASGTAPVLGRDAVVDLDEVARAPDPATVGSFAVAVAGRTVPAAAPLDDVLDVVAAAGPGPLLVAGPDGTVVGAVDLRRLPGV